MIVCLCHSVSDRTIDRLIDEGCSSLHQVGKTCKAGTDCGACRSQIKEMLRDAEVESAASTAPRLFSISAL